jgi:hypothetical protein
MININIRYNFKALIFRKFLKINKLFTVLIVLFIITIDLRCQAIGLKDGKDLYGGNINLKFEASGFFRIEKDKSKYWLVTPLGHAFLSHGINHIEPQWLQRPYNLQYWQDKTNMDSLVFGNINTTFHMKAKSDIKFMGFNTLGYHTSSAFDNTKYLPYVKSIRFVNLQHYLKQTKADFPDVFSENFEIHVDTIARKNILPIKHDPYLLGYSMNDCPVFTMNDAAAHGNNIYAKAKDASPTWPVVLRNLGPNDNGKLIYVSLMKNEYKNDIAAFNKIYSTTFGSFDELSNTQNWRPDVDIKNKRELKDNFSFLLKIIEQRYLLETAAIKKYDPNHLILGDKFNGNTDTPKEILALGDKYFDIIFIQHYGFWKEINSFYKKIESVSDKAIIMGDAAIHVPNKNMPNPYGPHTKTQKERIYQVSKLLNNSYKKSNFVGWHWCGWMDGWSLDTIPSKQHGGLQDPFGKYYSIVDWLHTFSDNLYTIH